jgi:hypothetical protein
MHASVPADPLQVPKFYREIRLAVIESGFRRDGDFCWIFGKRVNMKTLSPKFVYAKWVEQKFGTEMVEKNHFWEVKLTVDVQYIQRSWHWSKASFACGLARDAHFKTFHNAFYTKDKSSHVVGGDNFCIFCLERGLQEKEDNHHMLVSCPRAEQLYLFVSPILSRIANIANISKADLVLGRKIYPKHKQSEFNFLIHHAQLAIWEARRNQYNDSGPTEVINIFKTNVWRNLYRVDL